MSYPKHPNCRCTLIPMVTCAEQFLDLADEILQPHDQLILAESADSKNFDRVIALYKLGIDLKRARKVICLRAIMEDWDQRLINRELY